jgi:hypothetical protein
MTPCNYIAMENMESGKVEQGHLIRFFEDNGIYALIRTFNGKHIITMATNVQVTGNALNEAYELMVEDLKNLIHEYVPVPLHKSFINDFRTIYNNRYENN